MKSKLLERTILCLIIMILTALNVLYVKRTKRIETNYRVEISRNEASNNFIWQNQLMSTDISLNQSILIDSKSLDTVTFVDFCRQPKLILLLSRYSCEVCIDSTFSAINRFFKSDTSRLIIFYIGDQLRSAQAEMSNKNQKYPVYFLIDDNFEIPAVKSGFSFFFWLDNDCRTKFVFIPDKTDNTKTFWYFSFLREKYSW